jgi:hypothetical protein
MLQKRPVPKAETCAAAEGRHEEARLLVVERRTL